MRTRSALLVVIGIAISAVAHAGEWIGPYPVKYIEIYSGSVFFMLAADGSQSYTSSQYSAGCTNNSAVQFAPNPANPKDTDRIFAIGLEARASGLKVKFYVTGCSGYLQASAIASDPSW